MTRRCPAISPAATSSPTTDRRPGRRAHRPDPLAGRAASRPRSHGAGDGPDRPDAARDRGGVTVYTLILMVAVIAFAGLVLDGGLAVATKVEAVHDAQAAARAGARDLDLTALRVHGVIRLDPVTARTDAESWLARTGLPGTVTATPQQITVTVRTSRRTQVLGLFGIASLPVSATATALPLPD